MFMRRTLFLSAMLLIVAIFPALAMPPHPELMQRIEQGEVLMPYTLANRAELLSRGVDNPAEIAPRIANELDETNFNTLLLLLDFSDNEHHVLATDFDSLMYGSYFGTVKHFYDHVSYGEFSVETTNYPGTIGWLRMPQTYDYYVDEQQGYGNYPANVQGMVVDAINAADEFVDFNDYDNDGDGNVDGLMIVHAGRGAEYTGSQNMIWSHSWTIPTQNLDGVNIRNYVIQPEYWSSFGDMTCGVFCHEMGHMIFGLPDLYDVDYSSGGVGDWSLMAGGSWNGSNGSSPAEPEAWCRIRMGFAEPTNITTNGVVDFPAVDATPSIFRLQSSYMNPNEYFLVENRQGLNYDAALPADGLLVWHVDENVNTGNSAEWYPGLTTSGHYLVALEQADGRWQLEHDENQGDSGDPFPGTTDATTFDAESTPSSDNYDGSYSFVSLVNISASAETMSAHVLLTPLPAPHDLEYTVDVETGEVILSWQMTADMTDLDHFAIYRDGSLRGQSDALSFTDTLPVMEQPYTYTVSAVWNNGESIYNPSVNAFWPGAASPSLLRFTLVNEDEHVIDLQWNQWRTDSLVVDDGSSEQNTYLSSGVAGGAKLAQRVTAPVNGYLTGIRILLDENGSFTLGPIRIHVFAGGGDLPGDEIFVSETFTPDEIGWMEYDLGMNAVQLAENSDLWISLEWVETGHTMVGRDIDGPRQNRSAIYINDDYGWQLLDDALGGILAGNLMMRGVFGRSEAVGEVGLTEWNVYRDSELQATVSEPHYRDTLDVEGTYDYYVDAVYLQGTASSGTLTVDTNNLDVPPVVAQPSDFAIGQAYPNPFNPSVAVAVNLGRASDVRLMVYDILGRRVAQLQQKNLTAGRHTLSWTANGVASGVYFLRIEAGPETAVRKVVLMR